MRLIPGWERAVSNQLQEKNSEFSELQADR
jgi:hypothetical protein